MRQHSRVNICFALSLIVLVMGCKGAEELEKTSSNERPNVVIVLLDDAGFSDIETFGGEINTPNINALADDGLSLTQFYVSPRCSPTRASLLTGLHPHQVGLAFLTTREGVDAPPGPFQGYLTDQGVTLPEA